MTKTNELIKDNLLIKSEISQEPVSHIINILQYWKVSTTWVPCMLMTEMKSPRAKIYKQLLSGYANEGKDILYSLVTVDKTWNHLYEPKTKCLPM